MSDNHNDTDLRQRRGTIEISRDMLTQGDPEILHAVFSKVVVARAENDFLKDVCVYWCYSECFERLGLECPNYKTIIQRTKDKPTTVLFERDK